MTLVVCWKSNDKLSCAADTRISNADITISDSGGKLFVVPVSLGIFEKDVLQEKRNYNLGFAFCGSTLLANNAHAIATNCTQLLRSNSRDVLPSVENIANIYANAAKYVTKDLNSRLNSPIDLSVNHDITRAQLASSRRQ